MTTADADPPERTDLPMPAARHAYALAHPLNDPAVDSLDGHRELAQQADGNLLLTILAVDR